MISLDKSNWWHDMSRYWCILCCCIQQSLHSDEYLPSILIIYACLNTINLSYTYTLPEFNLSNIVSVYAFLNNISLNFYIIIMVVEKDISIATIIFAQKNYINDFIFLVHKLWSFIFSTWSVLQSNKTVSKQPNKLEY